MAASLDVRQIEVGTYVRYRLATAVGVGPRITARVTRIVKDRADLLDESGPHFYDLVPLAHLEPASSDAAGNREAIRYARSGGQALGPEAEADLDEGAAVVYLGAPGKIIRKYRIAHRYAYDIILIIGSGRDMVVNRLERAQLQAVDPAGRPRSELGSPDALRSFVDYARSRGVHDSSGAAALYGEYRRRSRG